MDDITRHSNVRNGAIIAIALAAIFAFYNLWSIAHNVELPTFPTKVNLTPAPEVSLIIPSLSTENTTWVRQNFPQWDLRIYVVDDHSPSNRLQTPKNKGHESTVYLTHIIDNYDNLPHINIFHHADRYQWHTDDPLYDSARLLSQLDLSFVAEQGFTSLKCAATFSCKAFIDPLSADAQAEDYLWPYFQAAFAEMFPNEEVPEEVAATCCAEFAATKEQILRRHKSDYIRYREWLLNTDLPDSESGRIMEYVWHMIFFRPPVSCPEPKTCYCQTFGLCDLECEEDGNCKAQYTAPWGLKLPDGWPEYDAMGNKQNLSTMAWGI